MKRAVKNFTALFIFVSIGELTLEIYPYMNSSAI